MTYQEALNSIPANAAHLRTLGFVDFPGFAAYYHVEGGERWVIENGLRRPDAFMVRRIPAVQH